MANVATQAGDGKQGNGSWQEMTTVLAGNSYNGSDSGDDWVRNPNLQGVKIDDFIVRLGNKISAKHSNEDAFINSSSPEVNPILPVLGAAARYIVKRVLRKKVLNNVVYSGTKTGDNVAQQAIKWLGKDYKTITNKAGDKIYMSKDGLRKIRFDIKNSHGDIPHIHLEIFKNGKWYDAIPGIHRIYPIP
jgi:hypothetical protein